MILSSLYLRNFPEDDKEEFPWSLPLVENLEPLTFEKSISFFVGENGSGKSTILEAIAAYTEVPLAGSLRLEDDASLEASNQLANYLSLRYHERTHHGFFVRAEDFIGFARNIKNQIKELDQEVTEAKEAHEGGDLNRVIDTIMGERKQLTKRYTEDLEAMSHGEGFLQFFTSRITAKGLYLIDEPEAALSPSKQLALMALILEKTRKTGAHFIIATHSPIIMSAPDSEIFHFKDDKITKTHYSETDHFKLTKSILDNPNLVYDELK